MTGLYALLLERWLSERPGRPVGQQVLEIDCIRFKEQAAQAQILLTRTAMETLRPVKTVHQATNAIVRR